MWTGNMKSQKSAKASFAGKKAPGRDAKRPHSTRAMDRVKSLECALSTLKQQYKKLRDGNSIIVPIATLDPEPFELNKEIMVVVQPDDDSFVATFFDANINASGNTQVDAVANLKDMIVSLFIMLEKEEMLGKGPANQLAVLRGLLRRKGPNAVPQ
jgi:hypothetical protein